MARLLKADGSSIMDVSIDSLIKMQTLVDGYIEFVYKNDKVYIVNEDGLRQDLPYNYRASYLSNRHLVGDVVECTSQEFREAGDKIN